jgi:DNA-binding response OmpR family regulator
MSPEPLRSRPTVEAESPADPDPEPARRPSKTARMSRSARILIVEDEPNVRLVFRTALASNDYLLAAAQDGETALRYLEQEPFDLVLLDLRMPGIGGMEMLRHLRERGNPVPVVIVTAHDSVPNVVQAMRLGAIDFVSKPLTLATLRNVVADVLARHADDATETDGLAPAEATADTPAENHLTQAKKALNRRDFDQAEEFLRRMIASDFPSAESHYLMGVLHEIRDEQQAAFLSYKAALRVDPRYEPAKLHIMKYFNDRMSSY